MSHHVAQIRQLGELAEHFAGAEVRDELMAGSEKITASTKPERVALWVKGAIDRLDMLADEGARQQIMLNCGYNCAALNKGVMEKGQARRRKFQTEDEFLAAEENRPQTGTRLHREGNLLYQHYTPHAYSHPMRCFCNLMRALPPDQAASPTYCQCSRGFAEKYWEGVLGRPVQVEVLGSCLTGAQECTFCIHL